MLSRNCVKVSNGYLKVLNSLILISALAIISLSVVLYRNFNNFDDGVETGTVLAPLIAGLFLLLTAAIGFCGVHYDNKCLLVVYLVLTANILIIILACGVALLSYTNSLNNVASEQASKDIEESILDFELALYSNCCSEPFNLTEPLLCSETTKKTCVSDFDRFVDFTETISQDFCDFLSKIKVNSFPIVGDPSQGSCGYGSEANFIEILSKYISDRIYKLGAICVSLSVICLLSLTASCVSLWSTNRKKHKRRNLNSNTLNSYQTDNSLENVQNSHDIAGTDDFHPHRATQEEINAPILLGTLNLPKNNDKMEF